MLNRYCTNQCGENRQPISRSEECDASSRRRYDGISASVFSVAAALHCHHALDGIDALEKAGNSAELSKKTPEFPAATPNRVISKFEPNFPASEQR